MNNNDDNINKTTTLTYLIQDTTNNIFKIGRSQKPLERLKQLKTANPNIKLIGVSTTDEKVFHVLYQKYRFFGEWFKFPDIVESKIINLFLPIKIHQQFVVKKKVVARFVCDSHINIDDKIIDYYKYNLEFKNYDVCREISSKIYQKLGQTQYKKLLKTNEEYSNLTSKLIYLTL